MLDAYLPAFSFKIGPKRQVKEPIQHRSAFSRDTVQRLPRLPWCSPWRWASHPSRWRDGWPGSAGRKTRYHRWPISSSTYLMVGPTSCSGTGWCWCLLGTKSWHEVCEWFVHKMLIKKRVVGGNYGQAVVRIPCFMQPVLWDAPNILLPPLLMRVVKKTWLVTKGNYSLYTRVGRVYSSRDQHEGRTFFRIEHIQPS